MHTRKAENPIAVSALGARTRFGKLLRGAEEESRSRLAAPEPKVLRVIGEEAKRKGADKLTSWQIDQVIKSARTARTKRG